MNRRPGIGQQPLQARATLGLRDTAQVLPVDGKRVKPDEGGRRLNSEPGGTGGGRMQAHLESVEVQAVRRGDHDLAIQNRAVRQPGPQRVVQLRKIPIERLEIAALDEDLVAATKDNGPKAVPLGFEEKPVADRDLRGELGEHGLDWRRDRKADVS